jgi:hypothetical protein
MNVRPTHALTALALAAATATLAGCSGGADNSSAPKSSPVAAAQDNTPLNAGDYRVAFDGALSGNLDKQFDAKCAIDEDSYRLTLTGKVNGVGTVVEISNLEYTQPGQIQLHDNSDTTANIVQSDVQKDWRNQGYSDGEGTITYDPDARTGSFDISVPEISYETAATLPNNPRLHLAGRWSCGTGSAAG